MTDTVSPATAAKFAAYSWKRDTSSGQYKRLLGGGELIEDVWNFHNHGEQNLYIGLYLSSPSALTPSALADAARKAWISTRYDIPAIATQILHEVIPPNPMPASFLVYTPAQSVADVTTWAQTTVELREEPAEQNLDVLREHVGAGILPSADLQPQTFLYVVPISGPNSGSGTTFGLLLRTTHVPFDGTGLKVLASALLTHLAKYIAEPEYASKEASRCKWGSEGANLLPVANDLLRGNEEAELDAAGNVLSPALPAEVKEGPAYDACLGEIMSDLANGAQHAHPFNANSLKPFDPTKQPPANKRAQYVFSREHSEKIIAAGAHIADERLTVNHLAHGALSLLTVLDNPPPPESPNVVFYYGLVNTRARLTKAYRAPLAYPGYCLSMSAIQIPVNLVDPYRDALPSSSTSASANDNANKPVPTPELKSALTSFAKSVKRAYGHQSAYPSLQAIAFDQVNMMLSAPGPPPPWCGPWFSGDGRASVYLAETYAAGESASLRVDDFFLGLNKTDPGPFFRIWEWKGRIVLSADYNVHAVDTEVVDKWMGQWKELLLVLAGVN